MDARLIAKARQRFPGVFFNTTCSILGATTAKDARNVDKKTADVTLLSGVKCRLMEPSGADRRIMQDAEIDGVGGVIAVPYGTAVTTDNTVLLGGHTYTILRAQSEGTDIFYIRLLGYRPS